MTSPSCPSPELWHRVERLARQGFHFSLFCRAVSPPGGSHDFLWFASFLTPDSQPKGAYGPTASHALQAALAKL